MAESAPVLTPHEISVILRDGFGRDIPRQRVHAILSDARGSVVRRKRGGLIGFQIMQAGRDLLKTNDQNVIYIDPETAYTGTRKVESLFSDAKGVMRICDPYVESRTLDFLRLATGVAEIRLLTVTVHGEAKFKADLANLRREMGSISVEVRVLTQGPLHDRYFVDSGGLILLGASLNGLGKKQSFVVKAGADISATVVASFDRHWGRASAL